MCPRILPPNPAHIGSQDLIPCVTHVATPGCVMEEEDDCVEGLALGGRGEVAVHREVSQERFNKA